MPFSFRIFGLASLLTAEICFPLPSFFSLGGLHVTLATTFDPFALLPRFACLDGLRVALTRLLVLLPCCQDLFYLDGLRVALTQLLVLLPCCQKKDLFYLDGLRIALTRLLVLLPFRCPSCPFLLASSNSLIQIRVVSVPVLNKLFRIRAETTGESSDFHVPVSVPRSSLHGFFIRR
jgi:hypothetical protein